MSTAEQPAFHSGFARELNCQKLVHRGLRPSWLVGACIVMQLAVASPLQRTKNNKTKKPLHNGKGRALVMDGFACSLGPDAKLDVKQRVARYTEWVHGEVILPALA